MENQNAKKRISIIVALAGVLALWACFYSFFSSDAYAAESQVKTERWIESVKVINQSPSITKNYSGQKIESGPSGTKAFVLEFKIKGKTTKTTTNKEGKVKKEETPLSDEARRVEVMQDLKTMKCYKKVGEDENGDAIWGDSFSIALTENQVLLKDVEPKKPNTLGELGFKGFKIETYGDFTNAGTHVKSLVIRYEDHNYPTYIKEARANFKVVIKQIPITNGKNKSTLPQSRITAVIGKKVYTGAPIVPGIKELKIGTNKKTMITAKRDKDYRVTFRNNINAGKAKAIIRGIGNFKGSCEYEFKINKAKATTKLYKIMSFRTKKKVGNKTYYMINLKDISKNGINLYPLGRGVMEKNEVLEYKDCDTKKGKNIKKLSLDRYSFYVTGKKAAKNTKEPEAKNINTAIDGENPIIYNCLVYTSIESVSSKRPEAGKTTMKEIKKATNLTLNGTVKTPVVKAVSKGEDQRGYYTVKYYVNNTDRTTEDGYKFKKGDKLTIKFVPTDKYEGCVPSRTLTYRVYR